MRATERIALRKRRERKLASTAHLRPTIAAPHSGHRLSASPSRLYPHAEHLPGRLQRFHRRMFIRESKASGMSNIHVGTKMLVIFAAPRSCTKLGHREMRWYQLGSCP